MPGYWAVPPSTVKVTGWPQAVRLRTTIEKEPTAWFSFRTEPCRQITWWPPEWQSQPPVLPFCSQSCARTAPAGSVIERSGWRSAALPMLLAA